ASGIGHGRTGDLPTPPDRRRRRGDLDDVTRLGVRDQLRREEHAVLVLADVVLDRPGPGFHDRDALRATRLGSPIPPAWTWAAPSRRRRGAARRPRRRGP